MAELNKETVKHLTLLSRIACTDEEQEAILKDLKNILAYVDQLKEVNTDNVAPCNHVLADISNVMREDVVGSTLSREDFLKNAPSHVGGMIKVPPVLKNHNGKSEKP